MKQYASLILLVSACHSSPPAATPSPGAALTVTAQIEQGKQLYVAKCAKCHGDAGQGVSDKGPAVVGKDAFPLKPRAGAKRDVDFHTAADVFAWATKQMPADDPASLSTGEYLAIFAFDLSANGVKLDHPLDGPTAQSITLHP
ncbi:MAG: hypothetical protein JWO36_2285 [Myxococcales bacterium]|nr:hypothetical protein [Myxococcales bacterium]